MSADDGDRVMVRVGDWLAEGGRVLLMTDYDGTLTPIVGDPVPAWLPERVRRDRQALAHSLAVAVHYRHVPTEVRHELREEIARAVRQADAGLSIVHGVKVIAVLPQVNWNKGACAMWIHDWTRRTLPAPMLTVYLGDDWTDEQAFEALAGLGVTVRVGARPQTCSPAGYRFDDVSRVHQLLAAMAAIVEPRRAP